MRKSVYCLGVLINKKAFIFISTPNFAGGMSEADAKAADAGFSDVFFPENGMKSSGRTTLRNTKDAYNRGLHRRERFPKKVDL